MIACDWCLTPCDPGWFIRVRYKHLHEWKVCLCPTCAQALEDEILSNIQRRALQGER